MEQEGLFALLLHHFFSYSFPKFMVSTAQVKPLCIKGIDRWLPEAGGWGVCACAKWGKEVKR